MMPRETQQSTDKNAPADKPTFRFTDWAMI